MRTVAKTKKKTAKRKPKANFCEQVANRPRQYSTKADLAVRKFEWQGTVAVPKAEKGPKSEFNRNLGKSSSRPKTEQTVSLNSEGTPDLQRIRTQTERKGSKPID